MAGKVKPGKAASGPVDINDPKNYKDCAKVQYNVSVCAPPEGTIVINKLEQAAAAERMGGKCSFTPSEIEAMDPREQGKLKSLVKDGCAYQVTADKPYIIAGTQGEMWAIPEKKLRSTYEGKGVSIDRMIETGAFEGGWKTLGVSEAATKGENMACFVPAGQEFQVSTSWGSTLDGNNKGVPHGKGDFVVCGKNADGTPNLDDRWIVNGPIFAATYDGKNFAGSLSEKNAKAADMKLPDLCSDGAQAWKQAEAGLSR